VPGNLLAHPDRRGNVETGKTVIEADYVVVGAGSAGCVVAARLSEDGARVVLLEAGPPDTYPFIHVPAGFLKLIQNPRVNWNYLTEPEPGTGNRPHRWPRGRVLGGTSSINGMLWVRGQPADYDGWAQRGCQGWSYEEVLPHFRRSERYAAGDDAVRGRDGPVTVEDHRTVHPLAKRFVEAAQQAGWDYNPDYNSGDQEGASFCQMSRRGRFRASTARTYLAEAKGRPNLRVETRALASRLIFEGRRCTGVAFRRDGVETVVRAARAVILSGGTINSPHLLQISGVGPAAHLGSLGVQPVHDLHRARLAAGEGGGDGQRAVARPASGGRGAAVDVRFARRADPGRHQCAALLPLARRPDGARPATQLRAGQLRRRRVRRAGEGAGDDHRGLPSAAGEPRHGDGDLARPVDPGLDPPELPVGTKRPGGHPGRHTPVAQDLLHAGPGTALRAGDIPGAGRADRRRHGTLRAR
jgi:choline dehydrogenase-like flavoprotein